MLLPSCRGSVADGGGVGAHRFAPPSKAAPTQHVTADMRGATGRRARLPPLQRRLLPVLVLVVLLLLPSVVQVAAQAGDYCGDSGRGWCTSHFYCDEDTGAFSLNRCTACPCEEHGSCGLGTDEDGAPTACACDAGYHGVTCADFCSAAATCSGHGTCTNRGICTCAAGWAGVSELRSLLKRGTLRGEQQNDSIAVDYPGWRIGELQPLRRCAFRAGVSHVLRAGRDVQQPRELLARRAVPLRRGAVRQSVRRSVRAAHGLLGTRELHRCGVVRLRRSLGGRRLQHVRPRLLRRAMRGVLRRRSVQWVRREASTAFPAHRATSRSD